MYFRDLNRTSGVIVKDALHWEPTMRLRWYSPYQAVRGEESFLGFSKGNPKIERLEPVLQQLWVGKATPGAQTILMKEWRPIETQSSNEEEF